MELNAKTLHIYCPLGEMLEAKEEHLFKMPGTLTSFRKDDPRTRESIFKKEFPGVKGKSIDI